MALGYQAYLDDLCPGCGWPMTFSMHKDSKGHWNSSDPIRCWSCTAVHTKKERVSKTMEKAPQAVQYAARPDAGLVMAMSDPVLVYDHTTTTGRGVSQLSYREGE